MTNTFSNIPSTIAPYSEFRGHKIFYLKNKRKVIFKSPNKEKGGKCLKMSLKLTLKTN